MASMTVDISNVQGNIREFPNGFVEATINEAKLDVSKKGDPMIVLTLEVYHPDVGTATVKDYLPSTFPAKVKAFYQAFNRLTKEEMQAEDNVDIDADALTGGTLIVYLGETEGQDGKLYKNIDHPWYLPDTRVDVLEYVDQDNPFD